MYELPPLRLSKEAYEKMFTPELFALHYGKHHMGYVNKLNDFIKGTPYDQMSLDEIIESTHKRTDPLMVKIFNNAAQIFNHNLFWDSISLDGGSPDAQMLAAIVKEYETYDNFKAAFKKAAMDVFGSGWVWIVLDDTNGEKGLKIITTPNGDIPFGYSLLLVCDVWEHAYYPKFKNDRAAYVDAFLGMLDWNFAKNNLVQGQIFKKD
ncbi:MAG: Superoxide dismutase [Fe] [Holosporales bacterium]